jgi:hypothetical protein
VASRVTSENELESILFEPIDISNVVIEPNGPDSSFGTEDPRAVYRLKDGIYFKSTYFNTFLGTYYVLFSAVANTTGGIPVSRYFPSIYSSIALT